MTSHEASNEIWEDHFYKEDKRSSRKERKIASKTDRSKYKKTDRAKAPPPVSLQRAKEALKKGRVISMSSMGVLVSAENDEWLCSLRGLLKHERTEDKNLVAVGDIVLFEETGKGEGQIAHVEPRYSVLSRADNLNRRKQQLIAVNIDQVLITASVVEPPLKPFLIDRYLIAAAKGGMQGVILINKIDLLSQASSDERHLYREFLKAYQKAGCRLIPLSFTTGEGISALKETMQGKTSVFSGQSGVGKTSLINLVTGQKFDTRKVVEKTGKGAHTTTHARLIPLEGEGFCIDTPGIKSFGVWNLSPKELEHYFPDIEALGHTCYFPDCSHTHEEDCAVLRALAAKKLSPVRYDSYCFLLASLEQKHLRR
jgi:ribosome biogenesis GTPase